MKMENRIYDENWKTAIPDTADAFDPSKQLGFIWGDRFITVLTKWSNAGCKKKRQRFRLNYRAVTPTRCAPLALFSWHLAAAVAVTPLQTTFTHSWRSTQGTKQSAAINKKGQSSQQPKGYRNQQQLTKRAKAVNNK